MEDETQEANPLTAKDQLFLFQNFANLVEGFETVICVKGLLIKGTLVTMVEYLRVYSQTLKEQGGGDALNILTEQLDGLVSECEGLPLKKVGEFIHLTNVSVFYTTGWLTLPYPWRGRISSIDGYM